MQAEEYEPGMLEAACAGDTDAINTCYAALRRYIEGSAMKLVRRWDFSLNKVGLTYDDCRLEAYIAYRKTLQKFKSIMESDKGPEIGYDNIRYFIGCFRIDFVAHMYGEVFRIYRYKGPDNVVRYRYLDAMNNLSYSVDEPIADDSKHVMLDLIADPKAELSFEKADDAITTEQLRELLETAIRGIPQKEAAVIKGLYYNNKTRKEVADIENIDVTKVTVLERTGLHRLRFDKDLQTMYDELRD